MQDCCDENPIHSDYTGLKSNYISVKYGSWDSYGGDQGKFTENGAFFNYGCGLIAFTDIVLYLLINNETFVNKDLLNELYSVGGIAEGGALNRESYYQILEKFNEMFFKIKNHGVPINDLINGFNDLSSLYDWNLSAEWNGNIHPNEYLKPEIIESQLKMDIPMVLNIASDYKNEYNYPNNCGPELSVKLYLTRLPHFCGKEYAVSSVPVSKHYVVITGIIRNGSDIWLEVSSNGVKNYINYNDYLYYTKYQYELPKFFLLNRDYKYENNILILKEIKRSYF